MGAFFHSRFNRLSTVRIQMMQPSIVKSHKRSKMIENPFLSFVFQNDCLQNHCWLSLNCTEPNFVAVVGVLLPICGQICQGMPYMCIFVEELIYMNISNGI